VSPVRVRVSPSRNPCKQASFVQRSKAREKAAKGRWPCCRSVVERPGPRRHSRERDEEYTMRFLYGRDPARRPRPICQPRPSRCRGRARRRRSCGVRRTASRQEALRSARAPIGRRVAAVLRRGHQQREDRADHQGSSGSSRRARSRSRRSTGTSPARSTWSSPTCTVRTTIFAARATEQAETLQGRDLVRAVGDDVTSRILQAAFRGCAFLNAVSEFEDPQRPCPPDRRRVLPVVLPVSSSSLRRRRPSTSRQRRPSLRDATRRRDERRVPRHAHHRHPYVRPRR
jgi:hypothetical protein